MSDAKTYKSENPLIYSMIRKMPSISEIIEKLLTIFVIAFIIWVVIQFLIAGGVLQ